MSIIGAVIRGIGKFDLDGLDGDDRGSTAFEVVRAVSNGVNVALETANAIPVVSIFSGVATMSLGVVKIGLGKHEAATSLFPNPLAQHLIEGGVSNLALGAAAVFAPGFGNVVNALAAGKDTIDVVSTVI